MQRNKTSLLLLSLTAISLSGCGYFSDREDIDVSNMPTVSEQSLNDDALNSLINGLEEGEQGVYTPPVPVSDPTPRNAPRFNNRVFDNINTSGDPSVIIFPLDGNLNAPALPPRGAPRAIAQMPLTPPAQMGQDFSRGSVNTSAPVSSGTMREQIFFKHGSSRLGGGDMRKIANVANNTSGAIAVEGHASSRAQTSDPVQSSILNLKESVNRAYAVSKALIQKGVSPDNLTTTAYGDAMPQGSESNQRRVDIKAGR